MKSKEKIRIMLVGPIIHEYLPIFKLEAFKCFGKDNFEIICVRSGEEALNLIRKKPINVVFAELYLGTVLPKEGKPIDVPPLNLLEEISKISPRTWLAAVSTFAIPTRLPVSEIESKVKLIRFGLSGDYERKLAKLFSDVKNTPWQKPKRISFEDLKVRKIKHITPSREGEIIIELYRHSGEAYMKRMFELGYRPWPLKPIEGLKRAITEAAKRGQLPKRELEMLLESYRKLKARKERPLRKKPKAAQKIEC